MLIQQDILNFLKSKKDEILNEYHLDKIGLFGSFSTNQYTIESDIDLIVEFKPNTENISEKKSQLKQLLSDKFQRDVDICREKYIKPYFKSQILKSAIYV